MDELAGSMKQDTEVDPWTGISEDVIRHLLVRKDIK